MNPSESPFSGLVQKLIDVISNDPDLQSAAEAHARSTMIAAGISTENFEENPATESIFYGLVAEFQQHILARVTTSLTNPQEKLNQSKYKDEIAVKRSQGKSLADESKPSELD